MSRKGAANFAGYFRLFRIWFWLGWPAFAGVIAIFALIIWSPRPGEANAWSNPA
jgi:uncharacterized membrane protein